jgi:rubrerythrin
MSAVKNTSFLEAVAAGIQHEKDFFDFCMKTHDELASGPMKNFFFDLAEDSIDHIKMIEGIYQQYSGTQGLPNLKHLGQVHKFHSTAIQKLIKKLDRNLHQSAHGNEIEALQLALQETQDATEAFAKLAEKFSDTGIKMLFRQISHFNRERSVLLEGALVYQHPLVDDRAEREYHYEVVSVEYGPQKKPTAKVARSKRAVKKPVKKSPKKTAKKTASKGPKKAKAPKKAVKKNMKPK